MRHAECMPLPPCLVHKHAVADLDKLTVPPRARRSPSAPPASHKLLDPSLQTLPLRPCCAACLHGLDSPTAHLPPLVEGRASTMDWCSGLHFTKGALRRRRSASVEARISSDGSTHSKFLDALVRVDEVDKKREKEAAERPPPSASPVERPELSPALSGSSGKSSKSSLAKLKTVDPEDEQDLFPLPSPRRTPTGSPIPSPIASSSCLALSSPALSAAVAEKLEKKGLIPPMARARSPSPLPPASSTPPIAIPRKAFPFPESRPERIMEETPQISLNSPSTSPTQPSSLPHRASSPSATRHGRRRPSLPAAAATVVRVGVGVLRGISMTTSGQSYSGTGVGVFV